MPWWGDRGNPVTLHQILVHMVAETHRHAGHADIVRETIDGAAGRMPGDANMTTATTGRPTSRGGGGGEGGGRGVKRGR